jgi:hypothetical protein
MIELNSFYKGNCLPRQCEGCQYGPWITTEVSKNGVEYGWCNLWNIEQSRPGTRKTELAEDCQNKKQPSKGGMCCGY